MDDTYRVSAENREGSRKVAFPVAAVFSLLSCLLLTVNFFMRLTGMYHYYAEIGILWTFIPEGIGILAMFVMTFCLLMRKRNAILLCSLAVMSLLSFWDLVRYVFMTMTERRFNITEFIGFTGYFGAAFLMWLFLTFAALFWFYKEEGGGARFFRTLWFFSGIMSILVAVGGLVAVHGMSFIIITITHFLLQIPFAFLMGWWLTHPYVKPKPAYSYASSPYGEGSYAYGQAYSQYPGDTGEGNPAAERPDFCPKCGSPLKPGQKFCISCGYRIVGMNPAGQPYQAQGYPGRGYTAQPGPGQPRVNPATGEVDAPNTGMGVLSFFFPGVGLILYLVWKDTLPQKAHSCGKGALIGFIVGMALTIIFTALSIIIPLIIVGVSMR